MFSRYDLDYQPIARVNGAIRGMDSAVRYLIIVLHGLSKRTSECGMRRGRSKQSRAFHGLFVDERWRPIIRRRGAGFEIDDGVVESSYRDNLRFQDQ